MFLGRMWERDVGDPALWGEGEVEEEEHVVGVEKRCHDEVLCLLNVIQ